MYESLFFFLSYCSFFFVKVSYKEQEWGWGVIVNFQKQRQKTKRGSSSLPPEDMNAASYIVDVLLSATLPNVNDSASVPQPARIEDPEARLHVLPIELHMVEGFSSVRLFLPKDIRSDASKKQVLDTHSVLNLFISFQDDFRLLFLFLSFRYFPSLDSIPFTLVFFIVPFLCVN